MKPLRLAVIDLGSNSVRLLVAQGEGGDRFQILDDEKVTTRLARGLVRRDRLEPEAMEETLRAVRDMREIARGYDVRRIAGVATSAVRRAKNGPAFLRRIREETGIPFRAIPGEEEARLAFRSALSHFPFEGRRVAVADMGGGSLEVVLAQGDRIERTLSLDLGAVLLTERFLGSKRIGGRALRRLERHVRRTLSDALGRNGRRGLRPPDLFVASGGTLTSMARMLVAMRQGAQADRRIHGMVLRRAAVRQLLEFLASCDAEARRHVPGLSPDRADIIVAGVCVVAEILRALRVEEVLVNGNGVREGLMVEMLDRLGRGRPASASGPRSRSELREESARALAVACRRDPAHLEQVRRLALQLFDALRPLHDLGEADREILGAAALLHDVGYVVGHEDHHKHAYHLIRHADLRGFSDREIEILANVARYYRGRPPRARHRNFALLRKPDRAVVRRLAALLRLADGLDRARRGVVRGVAADLRDSQVTLRVRSPVAPAVELTEARRRADLFEDEFDVALRIVRSGAPRRSR
ncbi:MAG: Ppx/GppA family phosphatase [Planctomycetes bacterium]|nr:Ppx/GppA family phosphatase [Planctomycetota bacterium]